MVYSVPGASQSERPSVLKLVSDDEDHGREMEAYLRLPLLCAKVFWQGRVGVKWPNDLDRGHRNAECPRAKSMHFGNQMAQAAPGVRTLPTSSVSTVWW